MSTPTKTPWTVDAISGHAARIVCPDRTGFRPLQLFRIADCHFSSGGLANCARLNEAKANAELIVRAVNNHQALVDALTNLLALSEAMRDTIANEPGLRELLATKSPAMEQARLALTLATTPIP